MIARRCNKRTALQSTQEIGGAGASRAGSLRDERPIDSEPWKAYRLSAAGETKAPRRQRPSSLDPSSRALDFARNLLLYPCQTAALIERMRVRAASASPVEIAARQQQRSQRKQQ
jgi:hypothetical protein